MIGVGVGVWGVLVVRLAKDGIGMVEFHTSFFSSSFLIDPVDHCFSVWMHFGCLLRAGSKLSLFLFLCISLYSLTIFVFLLVCAVFLAPFRMKIDVTG